MTREQILESIARCEREADRCRRLSGDKNLTLNDRVGAFRGELDWMLAKQLFEEDLAALGEVAHECPVCHGDGKAHGIERFVAIYCFHCKGSGIVVDERSVA